MSATGDPVPSGSDPAPLDPAPVARRRRRWPWVLGVILVLLAVGVVLGDRGLRAYAEDRIRTEVVTQLGLSSAEGVTVDLGEGSLLLQALRGRIDAVEVTAPDAQFGQFVGDLTLSGTGVPLDTSADVTTLRVEYAIPESEAGRLAGSLSGVDLDSVVFDAPEVDVATSLTVLFFTLPVGMSLEPSASAGNLVFTPTSVSAGGAEISTDELLAGPLGGLAKDFLTQQALCIDESVPANLRLAEAEIAGSHLILTFDGDGRPLQADGRGQCG